jgi:hypothetical protein
MKLRLLPIVALMLPLMALSAEVGDVVKFDAPPTKVGRDVMQAFSNRKSSTGFSGRPLPVKDLGNVLWAANGSTVPNRECVRLRPHSTSRISYLYVVTTKKVYYKYNYPRTILWPCGEG